MVRPTQTSQHDIHMQPGEGVKGEVRLGRKFLAIEGLNPNLIKPLKGLTPNSS